jgi:hypothetical protein
MNWRNTKKANPAEEREKSAAQTFYVSFLCFAKNMVWKATKNSATTATENDPAAENGGEVHDIVGW